MARGDPMSDAVAWEELEHAYGSAEDIPQLLSLIGDPDAQHDKAWFDLWGRLCHQGTVYSASGPAVPFLVRLARRTDLHRIDRAQAVSLIAAISSGSSYIEAHERPTADVRDEAKQRRKAIELEWVAAARVAVTEHGPLVLDRLPEATGAELLSLIDLAAQLGPAAAAHEADLQATMGRLHNREHRAAVALALLLVRDEATDDGLSAAVEGLDAEAHRYLDEDLTGLPAGTRMRALASFLAQEY